MTSSLDANAEAFNSAANGATAAQHASASASAGTGHPIAARRVPDTERLKFLPQLFGARMFFHGECAVYDWMRTLCPDYTGGYWEYFRVGDAGAGFMVPHVKGPLSISVDGNGYSGQMSAEAAGIVATLFALSHLMHTAAAHSASELLADRFDELRAFATRHPEASDIFAAID